MKANTTNENPVYACMALFGRKPLHPMMGLARLDETKISTEQISLGCYLTVFTQNTNTCNHTCDYSEATLIFLPPNGSFSPASSLSQYGSGYLAAIHPELMRRAASGLKRQHPSFFDYHTDEALHLSLRESDQICTLFNLMDHELRHPVDNCTETILSHHLQLFFDYVGRYYERQFITREHQNQILLQETEKLIDASIRSGLSKGRNTPTVAQIAGKLDHSPAYLCDLIKSETGKDWKDYLSQKRLDIARSLLCQPEYSAATVAHLLGYADCQLFCRMFKQLTGNTPAEYNSLHLHTSSSYN